MLFLMTTSWNWSLELEGLALENPLALALTSKLKPGIVPESSRLYPGSAAATHTVFPVSPANYTGPLNHR